MAAPLFPYSVIAPPGAALPYHEPDCGGGRDLVFRVPGRAGRGCVFTVALLLLFSFFPHVGMRWARLKRCKLVVWRQVAQHLEGVGDGREG